MSLTDFASTTRASTLLGRTVKQIDDRLNRLESELAPLRSDWTGSAPAGLPDRQGQSGMRRCGR